MSNHKIHILEKGFKKRHPYKKLRELLFSPYWFPVEYSRAQIRDRGYEVHFFKDVSDALFDCDILILSSRTIDTIIATDSRYESRTAFCIECKEKVPHLVWFDARDSAGNCQFDVLPIVDAYLKRSLYRDRSIYGKPLYYGREYTDYYHREYNFIEPVETEKNPQCETEVLNDLSLVNKMHAAWGCGAEYHWPTYSKLDIVRYFGHAGLLKFSPNHIVEPVTRSPKAKRHVSFASLFDEKRYGVKTVGYQRKLGYDASAALDIPNKIVGRVPRNDFYNTLADAKVTVSVFGWGEICFREYEATYCGSSILMADMSNIETYPNFYQADKYYTPFKWDFSDFEEKLRYLLDHDDERIEIATAAQQFLMQQWTDDGRKAFADHFINIITK
ncbi:MAG: hypothetical protein CML06_17895 [Pseudomonadales bacterium]|nr:hypothetical protein [Pseudomonadales bacterium]